jgi:hypothetical protein
MPTAAVVDWVNNLLLSVHQLAAQHMPYASSAQGVWHTSTFRATSTKARQR